MLRNLYVKNFALLDEIKIDFDQGLNIITGETGAGKSILIDALGMILGEKAGAEMLRSGADKAVIEGLFSVEHIPDLKNYLQNLDVEQTDDPSLILRKEIYNTGRSRAFVNDSPVTNSVLIALGNLLVDLHGQHEHQSLLKVNHHLAYLDDYGQFDELLARVTESYNKFIKLQNQLKELKIKEKTLQEKKELYEFQVREITAIDPRLGEEEELLREEKILQNSEKLFQTTSELYQILYEIEGSVFERLGETVSRLDDLVTIDERFTAIRGECESAKIAIDEAAKFLQTYSSSIEFNPQRLEDIRERLAQFSRLKKKYGGTIEEVLKHREILQQDLTLIENLDEEITRKEEEIAQERAVLSELCWKLSKERKRVAEDLQKLVVDVLAELGMKMARFQVKIEHIEDADGLVEIDGKRYKTTPRGMDFVEFFISANPGEDLKPLAKVASGGEISRIMLALKSILAHADRIPILVFDEIDLGISGRIAQAVGRSLKNLSRSHQIICITHLPQIASMGNQHFVVEKTSDGISTRTAIRKLTLEERATEIAKLLGGEKVTETHIQSARELMAEAATQ